MPNFKFTQSVIDALKAPSEGRAYHWDLSTPGFGIRIAASGKRTWVCQYRINGKSQMQTIASTSDLPSVKDARDRAQKSRMQARDGVDPLAEKRAAKQAKVIEHQPVALTFAKAFDRYMRESVERNLRTSSIREIDRMFRHDFEPHWGKRALADITRKDVETLMEAKANTRNRSHSRTTGGAGIMANRNLSKIKTFFSWCVKKELIPANPAINIDKLVRERTRERVLADDEIKAFWHATEDLYAPYGSITRLLLLTGQRRSEVSGMCWSEIDLDKQQWVIPRERAKNNRSHVVHLSEPVLQIIESIPRKGGTDLLFPSGTNQPVYGFGQMKYRLDAMMAQRLNRKLEPWCLHDLRRTCASGMAMIGVAHHVLDRILNHTSGAISGVAAIYNRFEYLDERKAALDAWADHVLQLAHKLKRAVLAAD